MKKNDLADGVDSVSHTNKSLTMTDCTKHTLLEKLNWAGRDYRLYLGWTPRRIDRKLIKRIMVFAIQWGSRRNEEVKNTKRSYLHLSDFEEISEDAFSDDSSSNVFAVKFIDRLDWFRLLLKYFIPIYTWRQRSHIQKIFAEKDKLVENQTRTIVLDEVVLPTYLCNRNEPVLVG